MTDKRELRKPVLILLNSVESITSREISQKLEIDRHVIEHVLVNAIDDGLISKSLLYYGTDAPAPIYIGEEDIGTTIRLEDAGFIDEGDREITLRELHICTHFLIEPKGKAWLEEQEK